MIGSWAIYSKTAEETGISHDSYQTIWTENLRTKFASAKFVPQLRKKNGINISLLK
jgi:hypothetical protein